MNYLQSAQALYEQMVRDRRHLHQHPEVGMDLPETCSYVMARLTEMGYQPRRLGGGVTATVTGKPDGKVFLLRADMDALPMREESGLPFASQRSCAHTCGHDMHTAMLLGAAALLNIGLDLLFVLVFHWGVAGAAIATVIAQYVSGLGLLGYTVLRCRELLPRRADLRWDGAILREILDLSLLTCAQQSAMNFGILLVQRLVDSFGPITMAAFAAAVKIDAFAYLPVQDFGNAFSTFIAQNYGAGKTDRLRLGLRQATLVSIGFSCVITACVVLFAGPLMRIFVQAEETAVIAAGIRYLRIEGAFYAGIGCLFLLYGFYRAVKRPGMSVVLTVISLGTRVVLAYALAGPVGAVGIWAAIPIGWALADAAGYGYYFRHRDRLLDID